MVFKSLILLLDTSCLIATIYSKWYDIHMAQDDSFAALE